jgi:hypothetical protein
MVKDRKCRSGGIYFPPKHLKFINNCRFKVKKTIILAIKIAKKNLFI